MGVDRAGRLVQDEDLRIGGQRPRQHEALPLTAGQLTARSSRGVSNPSGSASSTSAAEAACNAARPGVAAELVAQPAAEQRGVLVDDEHPPAYDVQRQVAQRGAAEGDVGLDVAPEPVGEGARLLGSGLTTAVSVPGRRVSPDGGVVQRRAGAARRAGRIGSIKAGSSASSALMRRAATKARVTLSAASVMVRSGVTRKAA